MKVVAFVGEPPGRRDAPGIVEAVLGDPRLALYRHADELGGHAIPLREGRIVTHRR